MAHHMENPVPEALRLATLWLEGEQGYQFAYDIPSRDAQYYEGLHKTMTTELPYQWGRFQQFRDSAVAKSPIDHRLSLQASQSLMKACGAAQDAMIYDQLVDGQDLLEATRQSWDELMDEYSALAVYPDDVPDVATLDLPYGSAIGGHDSRGMSRANDARSTFRRLSKVAITHLLHQYGCSGRMMLPEPGVISNEIIAGNQRYVWPNL